MNRKWTFRSNPQLTARLVTQCEKRGLTPTDLIRVAVELGLDHLEADRRVNDVRLAIVVEATQVMVDIIGRHIAPSEMEGVPQITRQRMDTYHVAI
jgi:hypothetical protein